ncbi:MAG: efflux RND transporter periplasmic adaptor subunit [Synergistales bacterium]|nr:efflux RND transporter periplasmic adaptor subunit [Synergistales bacterium]
MERRRTHRWVRISLWLVLLAAGIGLLVFRLVAPEPSQPPPKNIAEIHEEKGLPVVVRTVESGPWELWKSYYGRVRASVVQEVGSFVREYITAVNVEVGDTVEEGDVLLELSRETQAADMSAAVADYREAKRNYERKQQLYEAGGVPKQDVEKAYVALKQKKSRLSSVSTAVSRTKVRSEIDGVITHRNAEIGEIAEAGRELLRVTNMEILELVINVPPQDAGTIRKGAPVRVSRDGSVIKGRVKRIDPEATEGTGLYPCIVRLDPVASIYPGTYLEARLLADSRQSVVTVPYEVIRREEGKNYVFVLSGDQVERRSILTGAAQGGLVEVDSRLYPGERIVVRGMESLYDGARVWIQNGREKAVSPDAVPVEP